MVYKENQPETGKNPPENDQPELPPPSPEREQAEDSSKKMSPNEAMTIGLSRAGVILWEWDLKTKQVRIDPRADGHTFYYECSCPSTWERIVHKEDRERLLEALRRFQETPSSSFDCFFRLATKFTRWVHARVMHFVVDSERNLLKVIGLFVDVTESELAKNQLFWGKQPPTRDDGDGVRVLRMISERLRHEKDASRIAALRDQCYHQFMSVFSFSDIPSFRKDSDLFTIEVNPAMERLLGMSRDEIVKRRDVEIWGRGGSVRLKKLCTFVMLGETVLATTVRHVNGVRMEFLDQFYPEWGPNGIIKGVCGLMAPLPETAAIATEESPPRRDQVSANVRALYAQVHLAAQHDCNVLLTGESGTGKDYLARKIHELSKRANGLFENFNCAALQKELAGSELFGHEAGAFTGAKAMRKGIFELAAEGTVFLNEIGDMPLDLQPRLLTILETRSFRRVGGEKLVPLGARIIAAPTLISTRRWKRSNLGKTCIIGQMFSPSGSRP